MSVHVSFAPCRGCHLQDVPLLLERERDIVWLNERACVRLRKNTGLCVRPGGRGELEVCSGGKEPHMLRLIYSIPSWQSEGWRERERLSCRHTGGKSSTMHTHFFVTWWIAALPYAPKRLNTPTYPSYHIWYGSHPWCALQGVAVRRMPYYIWARFVAYVCVLIRKLQGFHKWPEVTWQLQVSAVEEKA